jgi:cytochrome c-type biogenesis protein CcmH/NrfG
MRNLPAAEGAFREAVRLDPQQIEAWVMLARIAAATQGAAAARAVLDEALALNPEDATLQQLKTEIDAAGQ